jgi:HCO3- transporter family
VFSANWTAEFNEYCITYNRRVEVRLGCMSEDECVSRGWNLTGEACYDTRITQSVADVFFVSIILFLGTFTLAMAFRNFRTSRFFPTFVRIKFVSYLRFFNWRIVLCGKRCICCQLVV